MTGHAHPYRTTLTPRTCDRILARLKAGASLDALCTEYHVGYDRMKALLRAHWADFDVWWAMHAVPKKKSRALYTTKGTPPKLKGSGFRLVKNAPLQLLPELPRHGVRALADFSAAELAALEAKLRAWLTPEGR